MKAFDEEEYYRERDDRDNYEEYSECKVSLKKAVSGGLMVLSVIISIQIILVFVAVIWWLTHLDEQNEAYAKKLDKARKELVEAESGNLQAWISENHPELKVVEGSVSAFSVRNGKNRLWNVLKFKVRRGDTEFEAVYDIENKALYTNERKPEFESIFGEWIGENMLVNMSAENYSVEARYADCLSEEAYISTYGLDDDGKKNVKAKHTELTYNVGLRAARSPETFREMLYDGELHNRVATAAVIVKDTEHLKDLHYIAEKEEMTDLPSVSLYWIYRYLDEGSVIELYSSDFIERLVYRIENHSLIAEEWMAETGTGTEERKYQLLNSCTYKSNYNNGNVKLEIGGKQ